MGSEGGHFITYCYDEFEKEWHRYDDNAVKPTSEYEEVNSKHTYILVYRKKNKEDEENEQYYPSGKSSKSKWKKNKKKNRY